jgi:hypothetical protein
MHVCYVFIIFYLLARCRRASAWQAALFYLVTIYRPTYWAVLSYELALAHFCASLEMD